MHYNLPIGRDKNSEKAYCIFIHLDSGGKPYNIPFSGKRCKIWLNTVRVFYV